MPTPRTVRVDIHPDVIDRLGPICHQLDVPMTWLVNHLLKTITLIEVKTDVQVQPERRVPVRRVSNWKVQL